MNRAEFVADMVLLVTDLIPTIGDDYRIEQQDDDTPTMMLTVGANADGWSYQTGDNSFTGGAYGYRDWAVTYLTRESNPADIAEEIASQLEIDAEDDIFVQDEE